MSEFNHDPFVSARDRQYNTNSTPSGFWMAVASMFWIQDWYEQALPFNANSFDFAAYRFPTPADGDYEEDDRIFLGSRPSQEEAVKLLPVVDGKPIGEVSGKNQTWKFP